jgi:Glycosyltransferase Family 4
MGPLRILITNISMWPPSGTVIYVRDLALELKRRGHVPAVFSSIRGAVVEELRDAGVAVSDRVERLERPDVIHAHHHAPFLVAAGRWPQVPAIYVCHSHQLRMDAAPIHPSIRRYFGVSRVCLERLVDAGVPEPKAHLLLNFVDTSRFRPREPLPDRPGRALVFSNYATMATHLPVVTEACRAAGIELDVAGVGVSKTVSSPEELLPRYDVVFAKGKAAMEAMAVGNAVVLCDFVGAGPMVTSARFDELLPLNFGFEALRDALRTEPLLREIARYDSVDATRVRDLLRSTASLTSAVNTLLRIYEEVIGEAPPATSAVRPRAAGRAPLRQSVYLRLFSSWHRIPAHGREILKTIPGVPRVITAVRRLD